MLAVAIEDDHVSGAVIEPITKTALDRFPFPEVPFVDNDVGAGLSRFLRGGAAGAVGDHTNLSELLQRSPHNVGDMFLFVKSRDDGRDGYPIDRGRVVS